MAAAAAVAAAAAAAVVESGSDEAEKAFNSGLRPPTFRFQQQPEGKRSDEPKRSHPEVIRSVLIIRVSMSPVYFGRLQQE